MNPRVGGLLEAFVMIWQTLWLTLITQIFNEPAVYASLTWGIGIWPPGNPRNPTGIIDLGLFKGTVQKAIDHMMKAHRKSYDLIKALDKSKVVDLSSSSRSSLRGDCPKHRVLFRKKHPRQGSCWLSPSDDEFQFIDGIKNHLDFLGLNYYGEERIVNSSVPPQDDLEYSESGRAINPNGFYKLLVDFHQRYNVKRNKNIPFIITENGISDSTDKIRPLYLVEHLKAIQAARSQGVPIEGYILWTMSDNWEWSDGYCPKFGIVGVDRESDSLTRIKRPSFTLQANCGKKSSD